MDENADIPTISDILDTRLFTLSFTVENVLHVLVNLDVNKSVSPDSIPLRDLSVCAVELTPSLNALYNLSLSTGSAPDLAVGHIGHWSRARLNLFFRARVPCDMLIFSHIWLYQ